MIDSPVAVLADGATGALITSVADGSANRRLHVDAKLFRPSGASLINRYLLNGSSANMMVLGSAASPVKFTYSPPANTTATVTNINLVLTAGNINFSGSSRFLNGGALPNGLLAAVTIAGVTSTMALLKTNEDFINLAGGNGYIAGTSGGLVNGGTNSVLSFSLGFSQVLTPADSIFFAVQDNITSANTGNNLVYMQSVVQGGINS
jgi:hypothetical protein